MSRSLSLKGVAQPPVVHLHGCRSTLKNELAGVVALFTPDALPAIAAPPGLPLRLARKLYLFDGVPEEADSPREVARVYAGLAAGGGVIVSAFLLVPEGTTDGSVLEPLRASGGILALAKMAATLVTLP